MNALRVLMCAALVAAPIEIADAQCYVDANGNIRWGIGTDPNITTASLRAVLAGFERQRR